ncbi:hypothetical protein, partial [Cronobacter sakazakii]
AKPALCDCKRFPEENYLFCENQNRRGIAQDKRTFANTRPDLASETRLFPLHVHFTQARYLHRVNAFLKDYRHV